MKSLLSGKEIKGYFNLTDRQLRKCRIEGMKCIMLDGAYYYKYNDVVEFLR